MTTSCLFMVILRIVHHHSFSVEYSRSIQHNERAALKITNFMAMNDLQSLDLLHNM